MSLAAYATRRYPFDRAPAEWSLSACWPRPVSGTTESPGGRRGCLRFRRESPGPRALLGRCDPTRRRPEIGLSEARSRSRSRTGSGGCHDDSNRGHDTGAAAAAEIRSTTCVRGTAAGSPRPVASTVTVHTPSRTDRTCACAATTAPTISGHAATTRRDDVGFGDAELTSDCRERIGQRYGSRARARPGTVSGRLVLAVTRRPRSRPRRDAQAPIGADVRRESPRRSSPTSGPRAGCVTSACERRAVELAEHVVEEQHRRACR